MKISFGGCGFLGIYHFGVGHCFQERAPELLDNMESLCGTSAGCLAAACFISGGGLREGYAILHEALERSRLSCFGPFSPRFEQNAFLRRHIDEFLPPNAHRLLQGRLEISVTVCSSLQNCILNEFNTRNELITAILGTCFIPVYSGYCPPVFRGKMIMDGGFSNNLPYYRQDGVVSVSPFPGDFDICPNDDMGLGIYNFLSISNMTVKFNLEHWKLFVQCLLPPDSEVLCQIERQGYQDALRYLRTKGYISESIPYPHISCNVAIPLLPEENDAYQACSEGLQQVDEEVCPPACSRVCPNEIPLLKEVCSEEIPPVHKGLHLQRTAVVDHGACLKDNLLCDEEVCISAIPAGKEVPSGDIPLGNVGVSPGSIPLVGKEVCPGSSSLTDKQVCPVDISLADKMCQEDIPLVNKEVCPGYIPLVYKEVCPEEKQLWYRDVLPQSLVSFIRRRSSVTSDYFSTSSCSPRSSLTPCDSWTDLATMLEEDCVPDVNVEEDCVPDVSVEEDCVPNVSVEEDCVPDVSMEEDCVPDVSMEEDCVPDVMVEEDCVPDVSVEEDCVPDVMVEEDCVPDGMVEECHSHNERPLLSLELWPHSTSILVRRRIDWRGKDFLPPTVFPTIFSCIYATLLRKDHQQTHLRKKEQTHLRKKANLFWKSLLLSFVEPFVQSALQ